MTATEAIQAAGDAGLTFEVTDTRLRVHGGSTETRARFASILAPLAKDIARVLRSQAACTLGQGLADRCPVCRHIHGNLVAADSLCSVCGAEAWLAVVDDEGGRTCRGCLNGSNPRGGGVR